MSNTNKIKKHQPNIKALIHNYCNGVNVPMQCASVSSGGGSLWSYNLQIVERKQIAGRRIFGVYSHKYSVTTSKHTRQVESSIPLDSSTLRAAKLITGKGTECDFKEIETVEKEAWNDKQYSHSFETGSRGQLNARGYLEFCKAIKATLDLMANKRVSRFSRVSVMFTYWDILKSRRLRKLVCPSEKPFKFGNFKKILTDYIGRLKAKELKFAKQTEARVAKINGVTERNMTGLLVLCDDWNALVNLRAAGWRDMSIADEDLKEKGLQISECIRNIAEVNQIEAHELRARFEEISGKEFRSWHSFSNLAMLRINGEEIETNRGARLPASLVKILWKRYGQVVRAADQKILGAEFTNPEYPIKVGPFDWYGTQDGVLTIGCHKIPASEIVMLADKAGW
jgi:hypothetical protein